MSHTPYHVHVSPEARAYQTAFFVPTKLGMVIGSIGGPIGTTVGGAVGAVIGLSMVLTMSRNHGLYH